MATQLPLRLTLRETATFDNFYPGDNLALINALNALIRDGSEHFIYLWGPTGVGRTHLLQACCHQIQKVQTAATGVMYLSLKSAQLSAEILQDLENMQLVCIDDIDAVLGNYQWEEALLHFYNRARDQNMRLVIAGNELPSRTKGCLADLRSRLSWGLVFHVAGLSDEQKIKALQIHAHERGIELSDEVGHFLLRHYPREMSALFNLLDKLDQASLIEKRKLTVPFVKQVLG
jgi:DnaA family protein